MESTDINLSSLFTSPKPSSTLETRGDASHSRRSRRTPPSASRQSLAGRDQAHRTARKLTFGSPEEPSHVQGGGEFTFTPPNATRIVAASPLDLNSVTESLETIACARRKSSMRSTTRRKKQKRDLINGLPDELLTKIFSNLDDRQGFRPRYSGRGPEWLFPPLRVALVCKRWLPIAQQLFYRSIAIHHVDRIPSLSRIFADSNLSIAVRHLSIKLPPTAASKLPLPLPAQFSSTLLLANVREADSDSEPANRDARDGQNKARKRPAVQDQLRALFQSCSQLLSLEIAGVDPLTLFSTSSSPSSSLHHLHQLRLSTISTLYLGGSEPPDLSSTTLRQALLALTSLRSLSLRGYVSDLSAPLDFAPTLTTKGSPARPLPLRARRLLKLRSIAIIESCMDARDLASLLKQVQAKSLEELVVTDYHDGRASNERIRNGKYGGTTIEGLSTNEVTESVRDSLTTLRVTLHNFPLARDALSASQSSSPPSPPRRQLFGAPPDPGPPHILDKFISSLTHLETLDLGGSLVSAGLLSVQASPHSIPRAVRHLTIRACPQLPPAIVLSFLRSVCESRGDGCAVGSTTPSRPVPYRLSVLEVFGGSELGWTDPVKSWQVQKACWDAGVKWRGGGKWTSATGGGGSTTTRAGSGGEWRLGSTVGRRSW